MIRIIAAAVLGLATAGSAVAGAVDDANARFRAIAEGDIDGIVAQYADSAQLQWVGGPLDGSYAGRDALRELWAKFKKSQGDIQLTVGAVEERLNPKGSTVSADVLYNGNLSVKVRHILVYREGRLVNEIWQIDPKLPVEPR